MGCQQNKMSIDGDLRAGVIDADHARTLRQHVQQEFRRAMDGAMKFVKGDTIAGGYCCSGEHYRRYYYRYRTI